MILPSARSHGTARAFELRCLEEAKTWSNLPENDMLASRTRARRNKIKQDETHSERAHVVDGGVNGTEKGEEANAVIMLIENKHFDNHGTKKA